MRGLYAQQRPKCSRAPSSIMQRWVSPPHGLHSGPLHSSDVSFDHLTNPKEDVMPESVYKVIELVGTSTESWEKAAKAAVDQAAKSLRDLRIAEVIAQDMQLKNGKVEAYRAKVKISFKFEGKG